MKVVKKNISYRITFQGAWELYYDGYCKQYFYYTKKEATEKFVAELREK